MEFILLTWLTNNVQASNLIDNPKINTKLYEIFPDNIQEIPLSLLKTDDLSW